ncbi:MAG: hypothetical protein JWM85_307, partial [Acidimicrobiaceae bacterium]|nr:hypothetical protein [Acidimicrobiaceae bacterium]
MKVNRIAAGAGALALSVTTLGVALGSFGSPAGASSTHGASFTQLQQQLEQQIANRQARLANLTKDVAGAKSLTSAHATLLNTRLSAETTNIAALAAKVPTDTTNAQLSADRSAMLSDNRVYAVMTPQVFQTIEADSISAQVTTLQADEAGLQSEVAALVGQPGY